MISNIKALINKEAQRIQQTQEVTRNDIIKEMVEGDGDLTQAITTLRVRINQIEKELAEKQSNIKWRTIQNDIDLLRKRQSTVENKVADMNYDNTMTSVVKNLSKDFFAEHQTVMVQAFNTTIDEYFRQRQKEQDAKLTEVQKELTELR